ncbi:hypothetical protein [Oscillatoria acuminata]|uniref:Uncharacterized protein n=1 Tax=Oscillatoria acuminata PCC 6304 TaxID=56110 RepID=K9TMN7_9CYAN|nr:hypothetical protein [Oscillatoria acuminata]AFY84137.1 hypothetical protein Oscil6304_4624 [Oscillatoria acuminata PCC 6304]
MPSAKDLIDKINLHEDLKIWLIQELQKQGIECRETDFYDEKGDIEIVKDSDLTKALEVITRIKQQVETE